MNPARDLLFALTRQHFTRAHQEHVEDICRRARVDWESVAGIAAREGVAPVVGLNLAACDPARTSVPAVATDRFQHALLENVAFKAQRRREFAECVARLDARGYDVLLLKSAALEATGVYRHPWVTCARDVDVVLRWRQGTQLPPDARAVERDLYESGVECDLTQHHDLSLNGIVKVSFDDLWRAAHDVPLQEVPAAGVYATCPEDLLLTLCLNACRKRYFRLKALFDIAETSAHYPDLDWDRLAGRARAWEAEGVAFAALRAADETLGLSSEARAGASALVRRQRGLVLGSMVRLLRWSAPDRRFPLIALQYAGFSAGQRWRSAEFSALGRRPYRPTAAQRAEAMLPGE